MSKIMAKLAKETTLPTGDSTSASAAAEGEGSSSTLTDESREPSASTATASKSGGGSEKSNTDDDLDVNNAALQITDPANHPRALKVLFLSSDTGGGHRASATSLAQQFEQLFPGSSYALCDIVQLDGPPPYNTLVKMYKHLSAHPQQWKLVYNVSNTRAYEMLADVHMKSAMERSVRRRIQSYDPDVVVSVHPLMTNVPVLACRNIAKETGKHLPIFTVCTDLGSAHSMWFANGVEKLFVASDEIRNLAMQRGKVPIEKIIMSGLPIRHDFAVQAEKMGDRHSSEGKDYRNFVRDQLGLGKYNDHRTVLVMGGGEGCGRLSNIVDALYLQFVERGMNALILVVCGRNETLRESLDKRDWEGMREKYLIARTTGADFDHCVGLLSDVGCIDGGYMAHHLRRIISTPVLPSMGLAGMGLTASNGPFSSFGTTSAHSNAVIYQDKDGQAVSLPPTRSASPSQFETDSVEVVTKSTASRNNLHDLDVLLKPLAMNDYEVDEVGRGGEESNIPKCSSGKLEPSVKVMGLGFITNMAEYMVATDVLVSKAGPGTIAEAASLSLPVMLTSFLPGQEEGNVDYVVEGEFGTFVSDSDPQAISDVVAGWLMDGEKLREMSNSARLRGKPDAAAEIVDAIGESALRWKHGSEEIEVLEEETISVTN
jgi:UDP-N-acetylglucosamine:LPS N-acetylglucosamine transferase